MAPAPARPRSQQGLLRLATLAGGAALAAWLMGGGSGGELWAAVRRAEAVRRAKEKVRGGGRG